MYYVYLLIYKTHTKKDVYCLEENYIDELCCDRVINNIFQ